ncbi:MAG: T9SS type A sorting domain-containing protein [Bacteroidetes bacterium]|nr:T9SS type A sorting domain-containing protein [Bacteroidota bacterium]
MKRLRFFIAFLFLGIHLHAQQISCNASFKRNAGNSTRCRNFSTASRTYGGELTFEFAAVPSNVLQAQAAITLFVNSDNQGGPPLLFPTELLPISRDITGSGSKKDREYSWCYDTTNMPALSKVSQIGIRFYIDTDNDNLWDSTENRQTCQGAPGTLPVNFLSIKAELVNQTVFLNWTTASESQNAGFYIERRAEGETKFATIGYAVSAHAGGTGGGHTYRFNDSKIPAGRIFYRLRQVDWDGTTSYSEVVAVSNGASAILKLLTYPNPSTGKLNVTLPAGIGKSNIELKKLTGEVVSRWIDYAAPTLTINALSKGMYLLKVYVPQKGESLIEKIMVQ